MEISGSGTLSLGRLQILRCRICIKFRVGEKGLLEVAEVAQQGISMRERERERKRERERE